MEINKINDFNLETGYNYVVTIALLLHGCIISTNSILIDNLTFNNVTGNKFEMTHFSTNDKKKLHDNIKNNFRKDQLIANNSNVLPYDKIIGETSPQDHSYLNCDIVNYIKKVIGLEMNGIFIISVHRKPSESIENNYQYLYPPKKNSIIKPEPNESLSGMEIVGVIIMTCFFILPGILFYKACKEDNKLLVDEFEKDKQLRNGLDLKLVDLDKNLKKLIEQSQNKNLSDDLSQGEGKWVKQTMSKTSKIDGITSERNIS